MMDKRALLGFSLCVGFYLLYTSYLQKKYPEYGKPPVKHTEQAAQPEAGAPATQPNTAAAPAAAAKVAAAPTGKKEQPIVQLSEKDLTIETKHAVYQFDQSMSALKSVRLKEFKETANNPAPLNLVSHNLSVQGVTEQDLQGDAPMHPKVGYHAKRENNQITFTRVDNDWETSQIFSFNDDTYGGQVTVRFRNLAPQARELKGGVITQDRLDVSNIKSSWFMPDVASQQQMFVVSRAGSRSEENIKSYCSKDDNMNDPALGGLNETVDYVGIDNHYFLKLFVPSVKNVDFKIKKSAPAAETCPIHLTMTQNFGQIPSQGASEISFITYMGPKEQTALAQVNEKITTALDLGWFDRIARPLLLVLRGMYKATGNWGLAIIIVTLALKMLFYPLMRMSTISMKNMQIYQPEMNRIKEKYKDNKQEQQRQIMGFMAKHKINPAKGCLPILPQIPVFIAFYRVLSQSIELRQAPFYFWIHDLSVADPYLITPLFLGVLMFIQQKLTPNPTMDKAQQRIMLMMPLMFTFMMLTLPAGMVIYMVANTILSILQQQWLNKRLGIKVAPVQSGTTSPNVI